MAEYFDIAVIDKKSGKVETILYPHIQEVPFIAPTGSTFSSFFQNHRADFIYYLGVIQNNEHLFNNATYSLYSDYTDKNRRDFYESDVRLKKIDLTRAKLKKYAINKDKKQYTIINSGMPLVNTFMLLIIDGGQNIGTTATGKLRPQEEITQNGRLAKQQDCGNFYGAWVGDHIIFSNNDNDVFGYEQIK